MSIVVMRGGARVHRNPYSLLSPPNRLETYEIAVRRMEESRGGSHFMHDDVAVGSRLEIAHPVNLFALDKIARKHLMIAGGIGITPFSRNSRICTTGAVPYELHYSVRAPRARGLPRPAPGARAGRACACITTARASHRFRTACCRNQPLGTHVYVCGPAGMIDRVVDTARELRLAAKPHSLGAVQRAPGRRRVRRVPGARQDRRASARRTRACWKRSKPPGWRCRICAAAASADSASTRVLEARRRTYCTTIISCRTRKRARAAASCPACRGHAASRLVLDLTEGDHR